MAIVDREQELIGLKAAAASAPSLVVLTGRRRVGKSVLMSEALTAERLVSFQANQQSAQGQLELLAREAARLLPGAPPLALASWAQALQFFEDQARAAPVVVALDEFQWLCESEPALPSIIQSYWDRWDREMTPVSLILCGSAMSFMRDLLDYGNPLYGRASYRLQLSPLDYRWSAHFTRQTDPASLVQRYAVLGGIPQYQIWAGDLPLAETIAERILAKGAPLYDDPLHLLREEEGIRDPGTYFELLRVIAAGTTQSSEIAVRAGTSVANASKKLAILGRLGYVEVKEPLEPRQKSRARSLHVVSDRFAQFWFRYVFPNRSRLERGVVSPVLDEILADLDTFTGPAFEECCRQWVGSYARAELIRSAKSIGGWWSRRHDAEIDVVAMSDDRYTILGSVKWRQIVDRSVLDQLLGHRALLGSPAAGAQLMLFGREGFTDGARQLAADAGVMLVTAADLFS